MTKPLIPWPGGKRRWADKLLPLFPQHKTYVEAFAGAAGLFFVRPEPAPVEVLNDINGDLVNLYRVVQHHLDEFVRQFRWALVSRQDFLWKKLQAPEPLTDIQRAARFFYLQKCNFGGKVVTQHFGTSTTAPPHLNLMRIEQDLSDVHLRLARVCIEQLPWADCLARYDRPDTLFFLDPPYWQVEGYGVPFELEQYVALAEAMRGLKGKAVLTINDHPEMRRAFAGFKPISTTVRYTLSKAGKGRSTPRGELIVRSWVRT